MKYFYILVGAVFTCLVFFAHMLSPVTFQRQATQSGDAVAAGDNADPVLRPMAVVVTKDPKVFKANEGQSGKESPKNENSKNKNGEAVNPFSGDKKKATKDPFPPARVKEDPNPTRRPKVRKKVKITFDSPERYKGPFVEGWPPKKNRNMPSYIRPDNDTFPTRPWRTHTKGANLLVVVHSALTSFDARQGIRDTWGSYVSDNDTGIKNVSIIFLVGNDSPFHNVTSVTRCVFK